jgi:hypothetical protein
MPNQGMGSVQEQSTLEQVSTQDTLRRRMVLLGILRFASIRFAALRFASLRSAFSASLLSPPLRLVSRRVALLVLSSFRSAPFRFLGFSFRLDQGWSHCKSSNLWVGMFWGWVVGDSKKQTFLS